MPTKKRKATLLRSRQSTQSKSLWLATLGFAGLSLLIAGLIYGSDVKLLNPKGTIAQEQFELILISAALLLLIGIPALFFFYFFAWKYRETNAKATHDPNKRFGNRFVFAVWAIPSIFAVVLTVIMWSATHRLEPNDPIASDNRPLNVQVVALRWKWLFIYPEQNIATVNYVQVPTGTPVHFDLTADEAPMSSFWIPNLGGQLYAMTGHVNRLNLMADKPGEYNGQTAEINGPGFAGMKFIARASSKAGFDQWVHGVRSSPDKLDAAAYEKLLKPSEHHPVESYTLAEPDLYGKVLKKYMGSHENHGDADKGHDDTHQDKHDKKHTGQHTGHP